ncbi:hypothetical protein, partial [Salmonella sp. SAL4458]|uniref:hypothetical protein n=1 Tax=Salmonella sp. SAL4458 TaxID=3159913 RepID=UPI00397E5219
GLVARLDGAAPARQTIRVWARLLAAVLEHWLMVTTAWGPATRSVSKACRAIRKFAVRLAAALGRPCERLRVLRDLER